jgi:predicted nucleic acid-binding Zn ribbon protein
MSDRLRRYGVHPGQHRVSALARRAAGMPAAIADLVGVNISTAIRWAGSPGVPGRTTPPVGPSARRPEPVTAAP